MKQRERETKEEERKDKLYQGTNKKSFKYITKIVGLCFCMSNCLKRERVSETNRDREKEKEKEKENEKKEKEGK